MLQVNAKALAELLGRNLRHHREECRYSVEYVSRHAGLRWDVLAGAENGTRLLLAPELVAVAEVLGVEPGEFYAGWRDSARHVRLLHVDVGQPNERRSKDGLG